MIGVVMMMPWLVADPSGYIFTRLVGYSALLGPIGGIMIAAYFVIRRRRLNLNALYQRAAKHCYTNGFSIAARRVARGNPSEPSQLPREREVNRRRKRPRLFRHALQLCVGLLASRLPSASTSRCER
jgi:Permease for cytosine/purines, uracil, thiamine, allantoin